MATKIKDFMLGVNYWDSKSGTDMWKNFDPEVIDDDLRRLSESGVNCIRCFPNWRDFQPAVKLLEWAGNFREYRFPDDKPAPDSSYVDPVMLERFGYFCETAEKYNIHLIVSIVTGWMSGRLFLPPAIVNKNPITDPEALMFTRKFVRRFVGFVKKYPAVYAWDLGNECNCMGQVSSFHQAYTWAAMVADAIRAEDNTRMIMSGMHGLEAAENKAWRIIDQGEITDMMTTHPYSSPTIGSDSDPMNLPRTTYFPTAQTCYYSSIGGKPAIIQEQGGFSEMLGNLDMARDFARCSMISGFANGSQGYLWWCAFEHLHLSQPPYTWSMVERELGIFNSAKEPKPIARAIKAFSEMLDSLPFDVLPDRKIDAVCITPSNSQWPGASIAFVLAKQAGFDITFRHFTQSIPEAPIYIIPSIEGWAPLYREVYDFVLDRVENHGASLYISTDSGLLTTFEQVTGLRSLGMRKSGVRNTGHFKLDGETVSLDYVCNKELLSEAIDAEVLAKNDAGNVVYARHSYGKGYVYLLGFGLETYLYNRNLTFSTGNMPPYYKIYAEFAKEAIEARILRAGDTIIGVTEHPTDDGNAIIIAVNYGDKPVNPQFKVKEGYKLTVVYGSAETIEGCNGAIFLAERI